MHQSALYHGKQFFETYCPELPEAGFTIVEIGSLNVNGSLRDVSPKGVRYIGLDFAPGDGVDIVLEDPYALPLADGTADVVVSSSCFEHAQFFWLTFLEAMRMLRPEGVFYLNAPSNGFFHRWPVDCWRFYPDAGHAMVAWARRHGYRPTLLESFVGGRSAGHVCDGGMWNDFVAVVLKDESHLGSHPRRIVHALADFSNGFANDREGVLHHSERGPDFSLIECQRVELQRLGEQARSLELDLRSVRAAADERGGRIEDLTRQLSQQEVHAADLRHQLSRQEVHAADLQRQLGAALQELAGRDARLAALQRHIGSFAEREVLLERQSFEAHRDATAARIELDAARHALDDARKAADNLLRSTSWRLTAPYRALRDATRPALRAVEQSDLLYRAVTSPLLLMSYLAYKGDHHGFYKSWRHNSGFVSNMIGVQEVIKKRLESRGSTYRNVATVGFALAQRVHQCGGVFPAAGRLGQVLVRHGPRGVRQWVREAKPGAIPRSVESVQPAHAPAPAPPVDVSHRILVADYRVPRPDVSAGERATVGILSDLCDIGYDVTFLSKDMDPSPAYESVLRELGVKVVTRAAGYESASRYLEVQGATFGTFYLIRVDVAEQLMQSARQAAPDARFIFHAPDLYFLREMRAAELQKNETALRRAIETRDREVAMMRQCHRVVVVSPAEVPVLQPLLPATPISVFPVLYASVVASPRGFGDRRHVFFLGGFGHAPNIDAVHWFALSVWPLVHAALPDAEFHVVGAEAPASILALGSQPGIRIVGYVPDLTPMFETMRVGVAPLLYGAGIKGKVAATLGAGIPCVCTSIAAEGMGIENGVHALVADDPQAFAEAVARLYRDPQTWAQLSSHGQRLVRERFGSAANRASLLEVLDAARALPLGLFRAHCGERPTEAVPCPAEGANVDVSIIVPVFDKWSLTRACLGAILASSRGSGVACEVLLADDGSSDTTRAAGELFPGLRVIRTPSNVGFLRNCNHAARVARGRHLVLLNNDTIVLPGWLTAMVRTIEADPTIAIVGSKLLYPDGRIQEAGGGLLSDAEGVSIGRWVRRGEQILPVLRDDSGFDVERETDYVSGASLLVRRSFWDAVGGFDERFQPAYCEDSDLAMTARAHGLRVVYQPAAEVVHLENQTYEGVQDNEPHRLMARNKALLLDKWKTVLERDHLPPGSDWHLVQSHGDRTAPVATRARRASGRFNVLYFSPFPSHPSNHGNQATIQQFARRFQALGHRVHFALLQSRMYQPEDAAAMRAAWDSFDILPNRHPLGANGDEIPFDGWYEEGLGEHVRGLCAHYDIDIVFCSYVFQSKLLEYVPAHVLKVIDTHDKMGDRYEMLRTNGQPLEFFSCTPAEEGAYLRRADVVVARRAAEARYFDEVSGRSTAIVIPHFEEPRFVERKFTGLQHVGMVASANRINLALVQECLAAIDRCLDGRPCPFVLHVAGQVKDMIPSLPSAQAAVFSRPWVRLRGFVPDVAGFYAEMDAIVSPVTMGTGINVKTVQAMAYGMPLVSTAWGTKGIETDEPLHRHASLDDLALSLLQLHSRPEVLDRLAAVSRNRYAQFLEASLSGFTALLGHPKLVGDRRHNAASLPAGAGAHAVLA